MSGSTSPVVRRQASSTSSVRPVPMTMSTTVSEPCRSRNASNPPPASPIVDRQHRVQADQQGQRGEQPVEDPGVVALAALAPARRRPGAVADEDQRQHRGQEQDQVVLVAALQRREHLPQHEHRDQRSRPRPSTRSRPGESRRPGRSSSYSAISSGDQLVGGAAAGRPVGDAVASPRPDRRARGGIGSGAAGGRVGTGGGAAPAPPRRSDRRVAAPDPTVLGPHPAEGRGRSVRCSSRRRQPCASGSSR